MLRSSASFQFVVLVKRQVEMNASASHPDAVLKSLLGREVFQSTTTLCEFNYLLRCGERQCSRESRF